MGNNSEIQHPTRKSLSVRVPPALMERLEQHLAAHVLRLPKTTFVLMAINEKINRDEKHLMKKLHV